MITKERDKAIAGKRNPGDDKSGGGSRKRRNRGVLQLSGQSATESEGSVDKPESSSDSDPSAAEADGMEILVETSIRKIMCLEVKRSDTIKDIKAKIQDEKMLLFDGEELEDDKTLADYGIVRDSVLRLLFRLQIIVNIYYGETNTPFVGPTITFGVESFDRIVDVKARIQEKMGIPLIRQRLIFAGKQLADHWNLADCCIQNRSTLDLEIIPRQRIHIKVKTQTGKTIIFEELESSDIIWSLKEKLYEKEGIPPYQQRLIYANQELVERQTLAYYKIQNDSLLQLELRIGRPRSIIFDL